jgi:hypothetical protein
MSGEGLGATPRSRKNKLLEMSEISLLLDGYDDIFSDFDPRTYDHRSLSADFLAEAKRASVDKIEGLELNLMVPRKNRDSGVEFNIKRRLREHFRRHHEILSREVRRMREMGAVFLVAGLAMMMAAVYLKAMNQGIFPPNMFDEFLFVLLEPAGWFVTFLGLERIFYTPNQKKDDIDFYRKMEKCQMEFKGY